jgi:hypothetical protein
MRSSTRRELVPGPAGRIECAVDQPESTPRGVALIAHPHPLYGGTLDNKVVQTLARAFLELGYETWRPNFRGVGATEGMHDRAGASWRISKSSCGTRARQASSWRDFRSVPRCRRGSPSACRPRGWCSSASA